ncbi:MAG: hypothetical protein HC881_24700 [Leptolyngbyaceae cyanobacterium SL_7_1]|nr:hypothetical protein [Leptolyngbyaceae cyanobacterium SL_7_1]
MCEAGAIVWVPQSIAADVEAINLPTIQWRVYQSLKAELPAAWQHYRGLVFCLATGAVVRLIAPLLQDKATDPAIVVVDERGQVAISLCGGHQAGADALTQAIALQLGLTPILTGAANALNLPGIDTLGNPFGWAKGAGDWTAVSAAIARQEPVQVIQDAGSTLWQQHLPAEHSFQFQAAALEKITAARVWISPIDRPNSPSDLPQVQWHPRVLWVGIGCERETPDVVINAAIQQVFQANSLAEAAIAGIATIDLKADEVGLLAVCADRHLPLRCFSAAELCSTSVPNPSAVVEAEVGTPSVAEAAALLASQPVSRVEGNLLVAKQIVRLEGQRGAVTIAVAQADRELVDRAGQLWLVGTGPGALEQITPAAKTAESTQCPMRNWLFAFIST